MSKEKLIWQAPANVALVIVDVQNDFCTGGKLAVPGGEEVVPIINQLREHFQTVVLTQDFHPEGHSSFASSHAGKEPMEMIDMPYGPQVLWPDHCVQGTEGADFHPDLVVKPTDLIIQKGTKKEVDSYSGVFENDQKSQPAFADGQTLDQKLYDMGVDTVVTVGLAGDFCVGFTAIDSAAKKSSEDITHKFNTVFVTAATRSIAIPSPDGSSNTDLDMRAQMREKGVVVLDGNDYLPALQARLV